MIRSIVASSLRFRTLVMVVAVIVMTIGITRQVTGRTVVSGLSDVPGYDTIRGIFASDFMIGGAGFSIAIVWWLGIAAFATWVLLRTPFGNWIFGVGGNQQAARNVGVPISLVKIVLFMGTAVAAWLVAMIQVLGARSADVVRGTGSEFTAIDTVAMSPCTPPSIFIRSAGDPVISIASNDSGAPRYASMCSVSTGTPSRYPIPSCTMPHT